MKLSGYVFLCDAIVHLMNPLVEIAIHDLELGTICYLGGSISKRKVGDPSLLEKNELKEELGEIIYPKLNFDGRIVKSISVPIENRWLICINCDVAIFSQMKNICDQFLSNTTCNPESLFKNDWQEKLHNTIHAFLNKKEWAFENLNGVKKKEVIKYLFEVGAFNEKNAANYIARVFEVSRATVFNYLREWKKR